MLFSSKLPVYSSSYCFHLLWNAPVIRVVWPWTNPTWENKKKLLLNQKYKKEFRELLGSAFLSLNISSQLFLGVCVGVYVCVCNVYGVCVHTINLLRTFSLSVYVDKCQSLRGLFAKSVITWGVLPSGAFLLAQITSLVTQSN